MIEPPAATIVRPVERLIFPLDLPDWNSARAMAKILNSHVGWFKVGLELFIAEGPEVIGHLKDLAPDTKIFLDLKLHDIPATVSRAIGSAVHLGAEMLTVHAQGGKEMLKAAVAQAGSATTVLAVTVLTSLNPAEMPELASEFRQPNALVNFLAGLALEAGCRGLVASGQEVTALRQNFGRTPKLVIPGIRPAWSQVSGDDQKRTATPLEAVRAGADYLVIGRPIRDAVNPAEAADRIVDELTD